MLILAALLFTIGLVQLKDGPVGFGMLLVMANGLLSDREAQRTLVHKAVFVGVALIGVVGVMLT